jgi:hypothetical protein
MYFYICPPVFEAFFINSSGNERIVTQPGLTTEKRRIFCSTAHFLIGKEIGQWKPSLTQSLACEQQYLNECWMEFEGLYPCLRYFE